MKAGTAGAAPSQGAAGPSARRHGQESRVDHQPAFVLHGYAWRETSLIVEALSRDFGRTALVARGAKRPTSHYRGILMPFSPLALSWSGRTELKTLVRAEWQGGLGPLRGEGLLSAFYLNELLVRLLPRSDPHPGLFASYVQALAAMSEPLAGRDRALRLFELDLLRDMGVAPSFDVDGDGDPVDPDRWYDVDLQRGLLRSVEAGSSSRIKGKAARALAQRDLTESEDLAAARVLLRRLIGYHLQDRPLNARRILMDLRALS